MKKMQNSIFQKVMILGLAMLLNISLFAQGRIELKSNSRGAAQISESSLNGFETTLTGNIKSGYQGLYTDGNVDATFNLIVEKGYNWENDKFFVGNITEEDLIDRIGAVQIGDTRYEAGEWGEILEFVETTITIGETQHNGFYINVVPEPAEWALIFGAIAFGFIAYRRRK
jgi:hypothetical protein